MIRCAVPTMEAAEALSVITKESPIPVIADIHFDYRLALAAIDAGVSACVSIRAILGDGTG